MIGGGYTFTNFPMRPRFSIEYNYASGDGNPNDKTDGTFDDLYPTNHKFFGSMDLFAWKNMHNVHFAASAEPHKTVRVQLDYRLDWLAESRDFRYRANQSPSASRHGATPGAAPGVLSAAKSISSSPGPRAGAPRYRAANRISSTAIL